MAVKLRMALGAESRPRLLLPMVVLKLRNVTWLSALTGVEAQIDAAALAEAEGAAERRVQAELGGSGDGVAAGVAPLSGSGKREGQRS